MPGFVVGVALDGHPPVGVMEKGEHIQGPVTNVFELLETFAHRIGLQIRCQAFEDLNPRAFVEEKQVRGRVVVETDEVLHLGQEIGVGDVKKIA